MTAPAISAGWRLLVSSVPLSLNDGDHRVAA
jgi:hypothetical protein